MEVFPRPPFSLKTAARTLRLHQWAKNALIFIPLVLGGKAFDAVAWSNALLGFLALGLTASATYIINDLWDLPSDRQHWSKRNRPLPSGLVSIRMGLLLAIAGLGAGFALAAYMGPAMTVMLSIYVAVTLTYSFWWKRVPVLDVLVLAGLFTLRLGFGIALTDVVLSPWLLVFSMFVFLSLATAKRHTEILRLVERGLESIPGRGYGAADAPLTQGIGMAAVFGSVLVMFLYLIEAAMPRAFYANPEFLWVMPPILFLFLGRIWLLCHRGQLHDDPVVFALKDRLSLLLGLLMGTSFVAALFGIGVA